MTARRFAVFVVTGLVAACSPGSQHQTKGHDMQTGNRLANEKSPYLLQHADNPVDWYPWGEEAFAKAKAEDKPIFLSIGYSTCHWCHVMEHESFEDSTVAALMNETFVNIKVDREERPDIDNIYMTVCQMLTGSGGWPLTIIMTPDRKPFFAATYIPRDDRYGRAGLLTLVPALADAWKTRRDELDEQTQRVIEALREAARGSHDGSDIEASTLELATTQLQQVYDPTNGGFGGAPKFPTPHNLMFLLRQWKRTGDDGLLDMVTKTLDAMALGGIYDHVGFGFHRYSTDARWFAPHFEKMLYDQALLVMAYTEAWQATKRPGYRRIAEEVLAYVLRDMTDKTGGFYSAEDADSEDIEGKFYLWTVEELKRVLGDKDGALVEDLYGMEAEGNFSEEVPGGNILYLRRPIAAYAQEQGLEEDALRDRLEPLRKRLFEERVRRIAPHKDDKILTDWNGLMIAALATAGRAFEEPRYTRAAEKAAAFVLDRLRERDGRLLHRFRDGSAGIEGNVNDYAFMIWGLIELHETTFNVSYLRAALELNDITTHDFWDADGGGFYFTAGNGEALIVRMKEYQDGALPSGNSVAMLNLIRLGRLTADPSLEERASRIGRAFSSDVTAAPRAFTQMLSAVDFGIGPSNEVVIVGKPGRADTNALLEALRGRYLPNKVVILKPDGENKPAISEIAQFTRAQKSIDGKATAYVCRNYACELPTTDAEQMVALLDSAER